jgi:hypothetical protein
MTSLNIPTVYSPVGSCIYCGQSTGKLSKEHIIPLALGGTQILPKASCPSCAKINQKIEEFCLRPMLGPLRIRLNLPTRHPKERPEKVDLELHHNDGRREMKTIPATEYPRFFPGFRWPEPGLVRGLPPSDTFEGELIVRFNDEELKRHMIASAKLKLFAVNVDAFARMLAKIAHAYAVAQLGIGGFDPH